jgi:hypothetical protein
MPRKPLSPNVELLVLANSRRRCCFCFGLYQDVSVKQGQIAHLDRDSGNSEADNLAYICLPHHDWFDARFRQSKGATTAEAKCFREKLYAEFRRRDETGYEACDRSVPAEALVRPLSDRSDFPSIVKSHSEDTELLLFNSERFVMDVVLHTRDGRFDGPETMTGGEIFLCLAPLMLGDAPEGALVAQMEKSVLRQRDIRLFGHKPHNATLSNQDFQVIKSRLWALGLIQKSGMQSVPETYWTLSPRGRHHLRIHNSALGHA